MTMDEKAPFSKRAKSVDLSFLIYQATDQDGDLRWSTDFASEALRSYKIFLQLSYEYPKVVLAVPSAVDKIWHLHILNTKRYFDDCKVLFGRYLHHDPLPNVGDNLKRQIIAKTVQLSKRHSLRKRTLFVTEPQHYATCVSPGLAA
jgi:hypothetical protein